MLFKSSFPPVEVPKEPFSQQLLHALLEHSAKDPTRPAIVRGSSMYGWVRVKQRIAGASSGDLWLQKEPPVWRGGVSHVLSPAPSSSGPRSAAPGPVNGHRPTLVRLKELLGAA